MEEITKLKWSSSKSSLKYVFHIFDAPPHGLKYNTEGYDDSYPNGCPCGLTHENIIRKICALNLVYIVYPLTKYVNTAIKLFQESGLKLKIKKIDRNEP
jgi:hypothetical protein